MNFGVVPLAHERSSTPKSTTRLTVYDYFDSILAMLKIRMQRTGRKHEPTYRLVLADSKSSAKSGKYLEMLGSYDSRHGDKINLNAERVTHWISVGAQVSPTVHNLLVDKKVITGKKINNLPLKKPVKKEEVAEEPAAPVSEAPAEAEAAEEIAVAEVKEAEEAAPAEAPETVA